MVQARQVPLCSHRASCEGTAYVKVYNLSLVVGLSRMLLLKPLALNPESRRARGSSVEAPAIGGGATRGLTALALKANTLNKKS